MSKYIRIKHTHRLPFTQADIKPKGWAIEARIYAEDPLRNFLPAIGKLSRYVLPPQPANKDHAVRVDTGVTEGSEISIYYDPMISKLITVSNRDVCVCYDNVCLCVYYDNVCLCVCIVAL